RYELCDRQSQDKCRPRVLVVTLKLKRENPMRSAPGAKATVGRLFVLDLSGGHVLSVNPDGSDRKVIVSGCRFPDVVVVDSDAGQIYWTNMGVPSQNDGSIERADVDGRNRKTWVSLSKLDLNPGAPVKKLTIQNGEIFSGEVSAKFTDAKPFKFLPGEPPAK